MTDIEDARKACYGKLKALGDQLYQLPNKMTRSNSKQAVTSLNNVLTHLVTIKDPESTFSTVNTHCIIMPLLHVYQSIAKAEKHGFESVIEPWLKIMQFLLSNTLVKTWMKPQFTIQLVILFSTSIDQASSEEIKHLSVLCLSAALPAKYKQGRCISSLSHDTLTLELQKPTFVPIASQSIMALLGIILNQQHQQLRLDAIRTLSQLLLDNLCNIDTLAEFLPGIASKLCATIYRRSTAVENHQIICNALEALNEIIQAVMSDDLNETLIDMYTFEDIIKHHNKSQQKSSITSSIRNQDWYNKSKQNLRAVLNEILKVRLYPDWRTRLAFVEFAFNLLAHCSRTLDNCIQPLVEVLVVHIDDSYDQVSSTCQLRMHELISISSFQQIIMPILKDDLYDWAMKFPQYIMARDEQEKSTAISLMSGIVLLLGEEAESVLSAVLSRCSDGWMAALQMDMAMLEKKQQSQPLIELEQNIESSSLVYPKVRFKHIVSDATVDLLTRLVEIIGRHCDLSTWVNHFMRYINDEPQVAYLMHALVSGASSSATIGESWIVDIEENSCDITPLALQLMNEVMDILTLSLSSKRGTVTIVNNTSSASSASSNQVLTVCLGLQIIGLLSMLMDPSTLQDQLITILYPLLAHLGSHHVYIHTYALITLDTIAIQCGLTDAKTLTIENMDYIINMISQHMAVLTSSQARVPLVLKALINVGGYATIAYLDDTVLEIYDALERYAEDDYLSRELCGVLFEVVQALDRHRLRIEDAHPEKGLNTPNEESQPTMSDEIKAYIESQAEDEAVEYKSMEDIGKYFLDRQEQGLHKDLTLDKIMEQGNMPMDLPKDTEEEKAQEDKDKLPLSHEQELAKSIMDKASHFLTSSSPQLKSQILQLLTSGVSILSDHPQQLSQLIYSMWPSILYRFNDPQNYVVLHAAILIEKVSQVSTDFLSSKFEKDLWPRFKKLIRRGVEASSSNYSVYSLHHRTQLCLLRTLAHIARYVPLQQAIVKCILQEVKFYYDNEKEHQQLREACANLYTALATQQPDTVWFYEAIAKRTPLTPPSGLLDMFQVPEWLLVQQYGTSSLVKLNTTLI